MIVPSSNRVVERVTQDVLAVIPGVDACFARIPYHGNGLGQSADRYDQAPFVEAAEMLAQARVNVLCWNATHGAALDFEHDRELCTRLERHTGLPAVTTALAALDVFEAFRIRRIALVTQGTPEQGSVFAARFAA